MIGRRGASLDELEELYRSRFDVFARVAGSVTGDGERARDAVQEAFATAVRKRGSFRGEGPLGGLGLAHRAQRCTLGRASNHPGSRLRAGRYQRPSGAGRRAARGARATAGAAADRRLSPLYADLDYVAIGQALGIRTGTVAATLNAAHTALRSRLEEVRT